jgi:hypothetical protein
VKTESFQNELTRRKAQKFFKTQLGSESEPGAHAPVSIGQELGGLELLACIWQSKLPQATVILGRLQLRFHRKAHAVPEKVEIFEAFVVPLQTQAKVSVTKENAASLSFFGTVVGVFVRCSLGCSATSSVLERRTQQSGSREVEVEIEIDRLNRNTGGEIGSSELLT